MASAVLVSRNESSWGRSSYSNPHLNPNPNKKHKQFHHYHPPVDVQQTFSDDEHSFNQKPESNDVFGGGYVTYNLALYTKDELRELRDRLVADVAKIQDLRDRIESKESWSVPMGSNNGVVMENLVKECKQVLSRLMKHKNGWIFNKPVDVEGLRLHDYHEIVKQPMDLGTVKSKLGRNLYPTPLEFAADVRLTFSNALLYNPRTDHVHLLAEQRLAKFEELFRPIQDEMDKLDVGKREFSGVDELQGSSLNHIPTFDKKPKVPKKLERMQSQSSASTPSIPMQLLVPPVRNQSPVSTSSPMRPMPVNTPVVGKTPKQPKPKAKDPNKREMSMEEKHKLGVGLQSLPQEKMPQLVQIIRKRNEHLAQDGDEIELDIEALDTETLWELDRFVTNWKKMVSKTKRQALIDNLRPQSTAAGSSAATVTYAETEEADVTEKDDSLKKLKRGVADEEDVEIDDDMPATNFPPVEIEKDEGVGNDHDNKSSSSSSSGSSGSDSSSSDSDSGSSSGSDSDADDAQS